MSAYEISRLFSQYGDVFCVKDDFKSAFIEFQHFENNLTLDQVKSKLKLHQ